MESLMLSGHSKIRSNTGGPPAWANSSAVVSVVAVLGSLAPSVLAQGQPSQYERFQLFNDCRPTTVAVGIISINTLAFGVTEERLRADAESRLRDARLHDAYATSSELSIDVDVVGASFYTNVQFHKRLYDVWTERASLVATWQKLIIGTHPENSETIVFAVATAIDEFIREYRRVNEPACESP